MVGFGFDAIFIPLLDAEGRTGNICHALGFVGDMFVQIGMQVDIVVGRAEIQFSALCFSSFRFMPQHSIFEGWFASVKAALVYLPD